MSESNDKPPPITEPTKRAAHEIEKASPHLKAAWPAVVSVAFISALGGFLLAWNIVVAGKNTTIETLTTASKEKDSKIDQLQKESEKLQRQNGELKTVLTEFVAPLKKRTLILAQQVNEFLQQHKGENDFQALQASTIEYDNRFNLRVHKTIEQLDEVGQHSDVLSRLAQSFVVIPDPNLLTNVTIVSKELERLANNLKE
jgi:hypothetical protein